MAKVNEALSIAVRTDGVVRPVLDVTADGVQIFELNSDGSSSGFVGTSSPGKNTIVLIGDSRIAYETGAGGVGAVNQQSERGAFGWANLNMGGRFTVLNYAGITGNTTTDVLARLTTDALSYTPGWYLLGIGVNDASASVPAATIQANITSIISQMKVAGGRVVLLTISPRNTNTTAQKRIIDDVNRWMQTRLNDPSVVVVDVTTPIADPSNGSWLATCSPDGLHQGRFGAARQGKAIAAALSGITPPLNRLPLVFGDGNNPLANPFFNGVPGAGLPAAYTGTGAGATFTTVARTDQVPGNWGQIDTTAGTAVATINQKILIATNAWGVVGDSVYGVCEIETDAWTAGTYLTMYIQAQDTSNATQKSAQAMYVASDGTAYPLENQPGLANKVVLVTPVIVIPATVLKLNWVLDFSGQGKVRVARAGIFKP